MEQKSALRKQAEQWVKEHFGDRSDAEREIAFWCYWKGLIDGYGNYINPNKI